MLLIKINISIFSKIDDFFFFIQEYVIIPCFANLKLLIDNFMNKYIIYQIRLHLRFSVITI